MRGLFVQEQGGLADECAIADTKIRGTQKNARRKKIRSQVEWFSQIAVLLRNREFSVSSGRVLNHRRPDQRASRRGGCSANSSATREWSHDSGQRPQLGGQVHSRRLVLAG